VQPDHPALSAASRTVRAAAAAVCVLLVGQGAGGATAAPAARVVLEAALKRRG